MVEDMTMEGNKRSEFLPIFWALALTLSRMPSKYNTEEATARIMAWCDRQERSLFEVNKKLEAWEIEPKDRRKIIGKLVELSFVDDLRFAKAFASDRTRFRNWGKQKIKQGLQLKGVESAIISTALRELSEEDQMEAISTALKSALRRGHQVDDYSSKMKLARHLASKGFGAEEIWRAIDLVQKEE